MVVKEKTSSVSLAIQVGQFLLNKGWLLATAESCTGGAVAAAVTEIAGSSHWFDRGFVTYSNNAKQELLGVEVNTLAIYGAVSEETAREMAIGALRNSQAQVSVAITGIAGPGGGTDAKPVGTVCFAWQVSGCEAMAGTQLFNGDRQQIREQAVHYILKQLLRVGVLECV